MALKFFSIQLLLTHKIFNSKIINQDRILKFLDLLHNHNYSRCDEKKKKKVKIDFLSLSNVQHKEKKIKEDSDFCPMTRWVRRVCILISNLLLTQRVIESLSNVCQCRNKKFLCSSPFEEINFYFRGEKLGVKNFISVIFILKFFSRTGNLKINLKFYFFIQVSHPLNFY